ncbi:MAG: tripartite tricarboxylate transporter substrate binding protein [Pigmentiphaga sp.]|uniref:Bug family tripartite tricarboxylate transporter substrate binding protein n=1 Tax=Pigmentiphaga sp. TaxID=1977564 RepID=UPI0029A896EB|nr:tripartite tricarboxylate transporter substrate binding protein [Pigmentiphaga sp.]MDX3904950.1 tripartite tricarboxylate transporter substrate binding protein [Pigmentiphaga sp.]
MKHASLVIPRLLAAALASACCMGAYAQENGNAAKYPSRTVKIVVPYSPGTSADSIARRTAEHLSHRLGQSVYVENRPGASGIIGTAYAAGAAPDGHTLMVGPTTHVITPAFRPTPYDPVKSFTPIGQIAESAQVIITATGTPASNFQELVAYLKSKGDDAAYSSPGIASTAHLYTTVLQNMVGAKMRHIPAGGLNAAIMDVVQGSVTMMIAPIEAARPLIASGKLKAIAQTGSARSPLLPNVPTLAELGHPDYQLAVWVGLYAPAGTPTPIIARLNRELKAIFDTPEARTNLAESGFNVVLGSPEDLGRLTRTEFERWTKVIKTAGINPE